MLVIYCRSHRRRPVRFGRLPPMGDIQGDLPAGWCECCGREVFTRGTRLCSWCQVSKGEFE